MTVLLGTYLFVLGCIFGSFALVVVDRMKQGKDWVKGRSHCAYCDHVLGVQDLVPVLSWLSTGGKCRYCKKVLSPAYPLTELGLGLAFLLSFISFNDRLESPYQTTLFVLWLLGLLIATILFVYDFRWMTLPSRVTNLFILVALMHRIVVVISNGSSFGSDMTNVAFSLVLSSGLFFVLYHLSKGAWIGDGDIFLGLGIGLFLAGPLEVWFALCCASSVGLVIATPKLIRTKSTLKLKVPFGPLLLTGMFIAYFLATPFIEWYGKTFLYL